MAVLYSTGPASVGAGLGLGLVGVGEVNEAQLTTQLDRRAASVQAQADQYAHPKSPDEFGTPAPAL
jgi:hypothetical protein